MANVTNSMNVKLKTLQGEECKPQLTEGIHKAVTE
jgi:hypothetical protein